MRIQELGTQIRKARVAQRLTQAALANKAGISRETLSLLENGLVRELGIAKIMSLLKALGLEISLQQGMQAQRPDFVHMACTTANVSFKSSLTEEELIKALVSGKVPTGRSAHLRTLFDEAPVSLLNGLAHEASRWMRPGKLEKNLERLITEVQAARKVSEWLKTG